MKKYYQKENDFTYINNKFVEENSFIGGKVNKIKLPVYNEIKDKLPKPLWNNNKSVIDCYYKAWEIAFSNIHNPEDGSGFVSPFIDSAFNDNLFMWDSCFITMFGKYASEFFDFQGTLNNFYALQHEDGYIAREVTENDGSAGFTRFDGSSTGPNILPWCEYDYYKLTGDKERVEKIFPVLLAYHQWFRRYRTWRDGSYWSSGYGCGMDNQPRLKNSESNAERFLSNGHMIWLDTCLQQLISCNMLIKMAEICNRCDDVIDIVAEKEKLGNLINEKLWDDETKFYYDLWEDDTLNMVKSVGAYWALSADIVPEDKLDDFVTHLENDKEFNRPTRVPSLSADDKYYDEGGSYWCGSIWAPTNYMVLKGLSGNGYHDLAFDIAENCVDSVVEVFEKTGTIWENYAPESKERGNHSKPDFVGWSGLFPISILIEYVFGIKVNAEKKEIEWHINLTDEFGVENLPLGLLGKVSLLCKSRKGKEEKPEIIVKSDIDFTLKIFWSKNSEIIEIKA